MAIIYPFPSFMNYIIFQNRDTNGGMVLIGVFVNLKANWCDESKMDLGLFYKLSDSDSKTVFMKIELRGD